jgi:chaperone BCS1
VLSDLTTSTPNRCIFLYEDIDAAFVDRSSITAVDARGDMAERSGVTLSGLLNTIDGVQAQEGRLLFATTNHPERIDPALARPVCILHSDCVDPLFDVSFAGSNGRKDRI